MILLSRYNLHAVILLKYRALLFFSPTLLISDSVADRRLHFAPPPPKSILRLSWPKFAYLGGQKFQDLQTIVFAPNAPKSCVNVNEQNLFLSQMSLKVIWGYPMSKICILCRPKLHTQFFLFFYFWGSQMPRKVIWGCPITKIYIFCRPKMP